MKIALIMLAAGNSRRFGSNKLLYKVDGKPMYRYILEKLIAVSGESVGNLHGENLPQAPMTEGKRDETVTVVTQYEEIEAEARALGVQVYINPHPDEGISSSLKIGLKANIDADACLFAVSDQPWLTAGTIRQLITLLETTKKGIACVSSEGRLGNPCIFTKKYYGELLSITGDRGGKSVITAHRDDTAILKVEDAKELTDIDVKAEAGRGQVQSPQHLQI